MNKFLNRVSADIDYMKLDLLEHEELTEFKH